MTTWHGAAVAAAVATTLAACGEVTTEQRQTSEFFVSGPAAQVEAFAEAERARDPDLKVRVDLSGADAVATFEVSDGARIVALGGRAAAAKLTYGNRRETVVRSSVGTPAPN